MALNQPRQQGEPRRVVFQARDLSKTYRMGEVEVRALRDVNPGEADIPLPSTPSSRRRDFGPGPRM